MNRQQLTIFGLVLVLLFLLSLIYKLNKDSHVSEPFSRGVQSGGSFQAANDPQLSSASTRPQQQPSFVDFSPGIVQDQHVHLRKPEELVEFDYYGGDRRNFIDFNPHHYPNPAEPRKPKPDPRPKNERDTVDEALLRPYEDPNKRNPKLKEFWKECEYDLEKCEDLWDEKFDLNVQVPMLDFETIDIETKEKPGSEPILAMRDFVENYKELAQAKQNYEEDSNHTLSQSNAFLECKNRCQEQTKRLVQAAHELQRERKVEGEIRSHLEGKTNEFENARADQRDLIEKYQATERDFRETIRQNEEKRVELEEKK